MRLEFLLTLLEKAETNWPKTPNRSCSAGWWGSIIYPSASNKPRKISVAWSQLYVGSEKVKLTKVQSSLAVSTDYWEGRDMIRVVMVRGREVSFRPEEQVSLHDRMMAMSYRDPRFKLAEWVSKAPPSKWQACEVMNRLICLAVILHHNIWPYPTNSYNYLLLKTNLKKNSMKQQV